MWSTVCLVIPKGHGVSTALAVSIAISGQSLCAFKVCEALALIPYCWLEMSMYEIRARVACLLTTGSQCLFYGLLQYALFGKLIRFKILV